MSELIPVFGMNWHLQQSPAQKELLTELLLPYMRFENFAWDSINLELSKKEVKKTPMIFFFFPPPPNVMKDPDARLIWIPMWDEAKFRSDTWWQQLPKTLRVVAFSEQIWLKAQAAGLPTLKLKYYKNPESLEPVRWDGRKIIFYWNRIGIFEPQFIEKLSRTLEIDLLLFRKQLDPRIPSQLEYSLPPKIGKTVVQEIPGIDALSHQEYFKILNQANIMIAPRSLEGVGLTFIEALARGCAVFALDAPTMNEYIAHRRDGYLLKSYNPTPVNFVRYVIKSYRRKIALHKARIPSVLPYKTLVTELQDWDLIGRQDLHNLGMAAREKQSQGFRIWQNSIPKYARFILDW